MKTPQEWEIKNWSNGGEVIDSRSIAQRIEDLDNEHVTDEGDPIPVGDWPESPRAERAALAELLTDIGNNLSNGWDLSPDGDSVLIIRDDHLEEYVKYRHEDMYGGDLHTGDLYGRMTRLSWGDLMSREPFNRIDWSAVAEDWQRDCAEIKYHGVTYYMDR